MPLMGSTPLSFQLLLILFLDLQCILLWVKKNFPRIFKLLTIFWVLGTFSVSSLMTRTAIIQYRIKHGLEDDMQGASKSQTSGTNQDIQDIQIGSALTVTTAILLVKLRVLSFIDRN